jgi:hypothetical protein
MPLMVWQLVVLPGTQTVTLVNAPSIYGALSGGAALGPVLTVITCTFDVELVVVVVVLVGVPYPEQPAVAANAPAKLK